MILKDTLMTDNIVLLNDTIAQINHNINFSNGASDSSLSSTYLTILLAFIAGYAALFQAKYNIISSARIKWNENMRTIVSDYYVAAESLKTIGQNMKNTCAEKNTNEIKQIVDKMYEEYLVASNRLDKLSTEIILNINSGSVRQRRIKENIQEIKELVDIVNIKQFDEKTFSLKLELIIEEFNIVFSEVWKKSKKIIGF